MADDNVPAETVQKALAALAKLREHVNFAVFPMAPNAARGVLDHCDALEAHLLRLEALCGVSTPKVLFGE